MSTSLPIFYDCLNCPSYCCTYPRIPATKRDIRRLAKHFEIPEEQAKVLLTESFVAETIEKVEDEALREVLAEIARDWLAANHAKQ